ncbi:MAG TPA: MarR family transcriptional regulator [Methanocorpusculum sp.]|nr:MarR family transcriptional regulator [Methanocorpusculum sp.]
MPESDSKSELDLYLQNGEVTMVRHPVRLQILNILKREKEVPFPKILEETGLTKSTLSGFLNSLLDAGLIERISSEKDGRRKIYRLSAKHIGIITPSSYSAASEFRELIRKTYTNYDKINYRDMLPHIFRVALAESGIRIDPVLQRGGIILGQSVAPFLVADTLEKTVENISDFWKRYEFGELSLVSVNPLRLDVKNCYECMTLPSPIPGGCIISTGILSALFSSFYGKEVTVTEIECICHGAPACRFEINVQTTTE